MEKSNGYEGIALDFIKYRSAIGASTVENWAKSLPESATILDIGCGTGIPISRVLIEKGFELYGVDASATLTEEFRKNFPGTPVRWESVAESSFYDLEFDAVIAWGLLFLMPVEEQVNLIEKVARHLKPGGRFLFTSPKQKAKWQDALTGLTSESLGSKQYKEILSANDLEVLEEFTGEGENYYYSSVKNEPQEKQFLIPVS